MGVLEDCWTIDLHNRQRACVQTNFCFILRVNRLSTSHQAGPFAVRFRYKRDLALAPHKIRHASLYNLANPVEYLRGIYTYHQTLIVIVAICFSCERDRLTIS